MTSVLQKFTEKLQRFINKINELTKKTTKIKNPVQCAQTPFYQVIDF